MAEQVNTNTLRATRHTSRLREQQSFEALYRESYALIYNYVRYQMLDDSIAQDIVSEAYLKAARAFERFDPNRAKFSTWVITIAKNCMRDYYARQRPTVDIDGEIEVLPPTYDEHPGLEEDEGARLTQALQVLAEEDRELVFLKYYQGMKNKEIAEATGMNASTVSTRLARALARLRSVLEEGA